MPTYRSSLSSIFSRALVLSVLCSATSFGAIIYDSGSLSLSSASRAQTGRLSRSGVPSDWSQAKAFPGALNPTIIYRYATYAIPKSDFPYLQISFYDETNSANVFASAYYNSYNPTGLGATLGLDTNYLGDAGGSGNLFGNPASFQIIVPNVVRGTVLLVVNDASPTGSGLGQPFDFLVEGFYDTSFNDTKPAVPEPASFALSGGGLLAAAVLVLKSRKKLSSAS